MARLLLLTDDLAPSAEVLPAVGLLGHVVGTPPADASALLDTAGPAEVDARLRLAMTRSPGPEPEDDRIVARELVIDEHSYSARLGPRMLNLTYKEFELLKHLAQHPGQVFTRAQLLQEIWGHDYYGGIRTVVVHVRRLRAKLGSEHEQLIGTVRKVGYHLVPSRDEGERGVDETVLS